MNKKELIVTILKKINMENINKSIDTFNKTVQDFGDSMDTMTRELSSDIEKSNKESEAREKKNKENLDKIWGKRKWDAKFVKFLTKTLVDFTRGKNNRHADYVAIFVTIFLGMETICTNIGRRGIEVS